MRLVLASSSPRRRELLDGAGFQFDIREPSVEEIHIGKPEDIVVENARRKVFSVPASAGEIVIGCDTVVVCCRELLGKPLDIDDARRMLLLQIEHPQKVISGIVLRDADRERTFSGYEVSTVEMKGGKSGVEEYLTTGLWKGKAGAYGIQDCGAIDARVISGKEDNVVGLPMTLLRRLLSMVPFEYPERTPEGV